MNNKLLSFEEVLAKVKRAREKNKKIVTTNGCFDIMHFGHLHYLSEAKKLGDILIVGINSDATVRSLKGENRPINSEYNRAALLAGLNVVDYVFIFDEKDPIFFLRRLKPNIHVKGGDYSGKILEQDIVEKNGGRVCLINPVQGVSTTGIIKKIVATQSKENIQ